VNKKKYIDYTVSLDDRIADGHYMASGLKYMEYLLKHLSVLNTRPRPWSGTSTDRKRAGSLFSPPQGGQYREGFTQTSSDLPGRAVPSHSPS
jgi:hypothetical protein